MYNHKCANCDVTFSHKNHSAKYCGLKCYHKSMMGSERKDLQKRVTKECEVCGDDFTVRECHNHVRTCSKECGGIIRRGNTWELVDRIVKNCVNCGKQFKVLPYNSEKKFCKRQCHLDFKSRDVKYPDKQRFQGASWRKKREEVIERDGCCTMCGDKAKEVHHKVPYSLTGDDSVENLTLLCKSCHLHVHMIIRKAKEVGYKAVYDTTEEGLLLTLELC